MNPMESSTQQIDDGRRAFLKSAAHRNGERVGVPLASDHPEALNRSSGPC
ncbi:MAG: hypothetical protein K9K88_07550 [Desulfobacterales bacterium]|nr:hypothetical protein [Desulfobacterales bacterium]